jgi:hypothetical protein
MASVTLWFGIALIALGVVGYTATGMHSPTALIPSGFGVLLTILSMMARNPARRKLVMHLAVVIALLGFIGSARGLSRIAEVIAGQPVERPAAVITQSIMAVLMLAFLYLCARSFVIARRRPPVEVR